MSGVHIPAASPSEVLIKAQYPSVLASASLPQQATADSTQLISQQLSALAGQTAAASGEAAVELPHQQSNTRSETVSLSEAPEAEQLAMYSAPVLVQPALTPETGTSAVNAEAASQRAEESNASVRDVAQGDMLESHSTAVVQPALLVGPGISTELSDHPLLSQPIQTGSIQLSAASDMQNHLTGKLCSQLCIDATVHMQKSVATKHTCISPLCLEATLRKQNVTLLDCVQAALLTAPKHLLFRKSTAPCPVSTPQVASQYLEYNQQPPQMPSLTLPHSSPAELLPSLAQPAPQ